MVCVCFWIAQLSHFTCRYAYMTIYQKIKYIALHFHFWTRNSSIPKIASNSIDQIRINGSLSLFLSLALIAHSLFLSIFISVYRSFLFCYHFTPPLVFFFQSTLLAFLSNMDTKTTNSDYSIHMYAIDCVYGSFRNSTQSPSQNQ